MIRIQSALVGAFLVLLLSAIPAFAHAELVESNPVDGGTIETPYTLTATFTEELGPARSFIRVRNSSNQEVALGGVSEDDATVMIVDLPALEPGEYLVQWQAYTPDDDHTERNDFTFTVAATPTPAPPTPTPSPTPTVAPTTAEPTPTGGPTTEPPTAPPTASPAPSASPAPVEPAPGGAGGDAIVAVAIGAVAIGALALFLFARRPR